MNVIFVVLCIVLVFVFFCLWLCGFIVEFVFVGCSFCYLFCDGELLLMVILLFVMFMFMFIWVFGGVIDLFGVYVDYVVLGIIFMCVGFGVFLIVVYVVNDMCIGIIDWFCIMLVCVGVVLIGYVVVSVLWNFIVIVIVIGVGIFVGFCFCVMLFEWIVLIGFIVLYIFVIMYLFVVIGLVVGSLEGVNGYGFILLFFFYLLSVFVFVVSMLDWLQLVVVYQLIIFIVEMICGFFIDVFLGGEVWWVIGWCFVILLVVVVWGVWLFCCKVVCC